MIVMHRTYLSRGYSISIEVVVNVVAAYLQIISLLEKKKKKTKIRILQDCCLKSI